jgi:hypothetical protein
MAAFDSLPNGPIRFRPKGLGVDGTVLPFIVLRAQAYTVKLHSLQSLYLAAVWKTASSSGLVQTFLRRSREPLFSGPLTRII